MNTDKAGAQARLRSIYDQAAKHMLGMTRRSMIGETDGVCAYRAPSGNKCPAGLFIDDRFYAPWLEGYDTGQSAVRDRIADSLELDSTSELFVSAINLIGELQELHDNGTIPLEDWPLQLALVALRHGLKPAIGIDSDDRLSIFDGPEWDEIRLRYGAARGESEVRHNNNNNQRHE